MSHHAASLFLLGVESSRPERVSVQTHNFFIFDMIFTLRDTFAPAATDVDALDGATAPKLAHP